MPPTTDLTAILGEMEPGDRRVADALLDAVYGELHAIAEAKLRQERSDHTLQPTALVHEAYMKLVDQTRVSWQGRTHFKAIAAQAMHRLLIDYARGRNREKRGGGVRPVTLHDAFALREDHRLEVVALRDALEKMRGLDERQCRVVEMRMFGGLSTAEIARMLDVTTRTVERDWKMGQTWLRRELGRGV